MELVKNIPALRRYKMAQAVPDWFAVRLETKIFVDTVLPELLKMQGGHQYIAQFERGYDDPMATTFLFENADDAVKFENEIMANHEDYQDYLEDMRAYREE